MTDANQHDVVTVEDGCGRFGVTTTQRFASRLLESIVAVVAVDRSIDDGCCCDRPYCCVRIGRRSRTKVRPGNRTGPSKLKPLNW